MPESAAVLPLAHLYGAESAEVPSSGLVATISWPDHTIESYTNLPSDAKRPFIISKIMILVVFGILIPDEKHRAFLSLHKRRQTAAYRQNPSKTILIWQKSIE